MFTLLDARLILSLLLLLAWVVPSGAAEAPFTSSIAQASAEHPHNSEGDIIVLRDGTLFAAWSQFYGGAEDHAAARIVAVKSPDGGRTWGRPTTIHENHGGANVMSVSLLRSSSGDVLFFYLIKNSLSDLKAYVRRSKDDTQSWGEPTLITPEPGYHVMNNGNSKASRWIG